MSSSPPSETGRGAPLPARSGLSTVLAAQAGAFLSREEPAKRAGKNVLAGADKKVTASVQPYYFAGTPRRTPCLTNGGKSYRAMPSGLRAALSALRRWACS